MTKKQIKKVLSLVNKQLNEKLDNEYKVYWQVKDYTEYFTIVKNAIVKYQVKIFEN